MATLFSGETKIWEEALSARGATQPGAFLQSTIWQEVLWRRGRHTAMILDADGNPSLWFWSQLRLGLGVWFCAKGPLVLPPENDWSEIINLLQQEKAAAILRWEPAVFPPPVVAGKKIHWRPEVSPANTLVTIINLPDEELLAQFHEKTRYNIHLAERHRVSVRPLSTEEARAQWPEIMRLFLATGERHGINQLTEKDYAAMLGAVTVWVAEWENKIVATSFQIGFGKIMTYVHGASLYEARAVMAPYLLHWEIMRAARAAGFEFYDWWGIAPAGSTSHKLSGVTRFKLGFGGERVASPGTAEIGIDRWRFGLYTLGKRIFRRP